MNKYLKYIALTIVIQLLSNFLIAQGLVSTVSFSLGTPFVEGEGRQIIKLSQTEFMVLTKVKGALAGESSYSLERYNGSLQTTFKIALTISANEDFKDIFYNGTDLIVFSVMHNKEEHSSKLLAYGYDINNGSKKWDKVLQEASITEWVDSKYKGAVKETFENSVAGSIGRGFITPVQYQYEIKFSPDSNSILTYIFDYGQKTLYANAIVFDKTLNKKKEGIVPIDNNFINYGIYVNNRAEVYILNEDHQGRIVVIQYNMETRDNKLLDIQYANSQRSSLILKFLNDDVVFVANITTQKGKFLGVMYSKFNFSTNLVEKINFHDLSEGMLQTIAATREGNKNVPAEDSWLNYQITDFILNEYEKVIIVLEKREIQTQTVLYDATVVNDVQHWKERPGRIDTEAVLLFSFNSEDELMWENFYIKSQVSDVTTGMSSNSFVLDNSQEGKIRMVYGSPTGASGVFNLYNYIEWDEHTGSKLKDIQLPNEEGLTLVRTYTIWWNDKLVVVGRKGIMGKKSFMSLYKI